MKLQTRKAIVAFSIFLAALFVLAQFVFRTVFIGGWCSPYLDAPQELGHPAYQYFDYGFPLPLLEVSLEGCFEAQSTTYEWSPTGMAVNSLLLALIVYPTWSRFLRKRAKNPE